MSNSIKEASRPSPCAGAPEAAFTIVEVLALLAILGLMAITVVISLRSIV